MRAPTSHHHEIIVTEARENFAQSLLLAWLDCRRLADLKNSSLWRCIFTPQFTSVLLYRLSRALFLSPLKPLSIIPTVANNLLFGVEISPRTAIGPGFILPHPNSIVIGAISIGESAIIYQQTTLGSKSFDNGFNAHMRPTIGNNVTIGCGAVVLGNIHIIDNTLVRANSLTTSSSK